jgi:type I protein arginine methyltransferase
MASASEKTSFTNYSVDGEIPSYNGDEKAKATDFANYFCSYAQLYHQKQMLADHNRMAAYHAAILGNAEVFQDKVVMDIGTGSGILAVWAAQAGARKVYAIEYTDMAKHAESVMKANGVDHIVTVIQSSVEDVVLPIEADGLEVEIDDDDDEIMQKNADGTMEKKKNVRCVDIILSEWMGYFLLRESMLDSIIRGRDTFLKRKTGLMLPSHTTMYVAPVVDEGERKHNNNDYAAAMSDWHDFETTTSQVYGVNMSCLESEFDKEQKEYYLHSSRWTELKSDQLLDDPSIIKQLDMITCTLNDARGVYLPTSSTDAAADVDEFGCRDTPQFEFRVNGDELYGPISGISGWFTADFKSRTDAYGLKNGAPTINHPSFLSTGPENGYTHWGQQTFYFPSAIPVLKGEITIVQGAIEMMRTKENARLYNCRVEYQSSRIRKDKTTKEQQVLMKSTKVSQVYHIP